MIEGEGVPMSFMNEVNARSGKSLQNIQITVIGSKNSKSEHDTVQFFTPKKVLHSTSQSLFTL